MRGQPGHNTPHNTRTSFVGMDAWMTSQLNETLIRNLRVSLVWLAYFFDLVMLVSMDVCTTRHWQMSGQLVQELNTCTVCLRYWERFSRTAKTDTRRPVDCTTVKSGLVTFHLTISKMQILCQIVFSIKNVFLSRHAVFRPKNYYKYSGDI